MKSAELTGISDYKHTHLHFMFTPDLLSLPLQGCFESLLYSHKKDIFDPNTIATQRWLLAMGKSPQKVAISFFVASPYVILKCGQAVCIL